MKQLRKKPTKAQEWQRKRFQAKGSVCGTITLLKKLQKLNIFTISEGYYIEDCISRLASIKTNWENFNKMSKRKYLS